MDFVYLWKNRRRPPFGSKAWVKIWARRGLTARKLLVLSWQAAKLTRKGAVLGRLAIADRVHLNGSAARLQLGDFSVLGRNTSLALHGNVTIGKCVCVNSDVTFLTASHDISDPQWRMKIRPIVIHDFAWIATGATILPGVEIGKGAVVGANSVVSKDVPEGRIAVGNPAVLLDKRRSEALMYQPSTFMSALSAWIDPDTHGEE